MKKRTTARTILLAVLLLVVGTPLLLVLSAAAYIYSQDRTNGVLVSSDEEREYLIHVPSSYEPAIPTPLVISIHGAGGWPAQQMETSRWNPVSDRNGFIVVYPSARRWSLGPRLWAAMPGADLGADVGFISDLIDALERDYNIDPSRIYVNGLSLGGAMTFALSCTLGDRIAAVGTVAAALTLPFSWCPSPVPMPLIAFHGTADPMVPYEGREPDDSFLPEGIPSVESWIASWAERNHCTGLPTQSVVAADVTRTEYGGCEGDAQVVFYSVLGGGHTWPGGEPLREFITGPTSDSVDASDLMWSFFRAHALTGR